MGGRPSASSEPYLRAGNPFEELQRRDRRTLNLQQVAPLRIVFRDLVEQQLAEPADHREMIPELVDQAGRSCGQTRGHDEASGRVRRAANSRYQN